MSEPDAQLDRLFDEMAAEIDASEPETAEARRRQRAIGGMHAIHRSLLVEDSRKPGRRRYYAWVGLVAALAICGTALAAARGVLPLPFHDAHRVLERAPAAAAKSRSLGAPKEVLTPPASVAQPTRDQPAQPTQAPEAIVSQATPGRTARTVQSAELEEVNRLFAEAKRARREHRDVEALGLLEQLLSKHGGSVLAHEARVERFRTLARLGRIEEARRDAQAYLARYPTGFGADEARALVDGATP